MRNIILAVLALLWAIPAQAQAPSVDYLCIYTGLPCSAANGNLVSASHPLPVNASVSASISGFTAASTGTPISVTTGGVTGTLPAGTVVVTSNVGATNGAYCKLGASATVADQLIPPSSWFAFTVGASTQLTCITSAGTTTVNMVGGAGLPTGSGGGGGGSGGGGAVTIADGADVTQGAKADAKSTATDTTPITIMSVLKQVSASVQAAAASLASLVTGQTTGNGSLATIATNSSPTLTGAAAPAATNYIGNNVGGNLTGQIGCGLSVVYDASTNGSTELVALTSTQSVYVCGYSVFAAGTVNVEFDYGTGTACATGNTKVIPAYQLTAQTGMSDQSPIYRGLKGAASNALCIKTSAGVAVQAIVYYTKF